MKNKSKSHYGFKRQPPEENSSIISQTRGARSYNRLGEFRLQDLYATIMQSHVTSIRKGQCVFLMPPFSNVFGLYGVF